MYRETKQWNSLKILIGITVLTTMSLAAGNALAIFGGAPTASQPPSPSLPAEPTTLHELSQPGGPLNEESDSGGPDTGVAVDTLPDDHYLAKGGGIQMSSISGEDFEPETAAQRSTRAMGEAILGKGKTTGMTTEQIDAHLQLAAENSVNRARHAEGVDNYTGEGTSLKLTPDGLEHPTAYGAGDLTAAQENIARLRNLRGATTDNTTTTADAADSGVGESDSEIQNALDQDKAVATTDAPSANAIPASEASSQLNEQTGELSSGASQYQTTATAAEHVATDAQTAAQGTGDLSTIATDTGEITGDVLDH
jgi:X-X-X-Leu-X-X-Gly heptad repeat protein